MWSIWFGFDRNCDVFVSIWVYKIVFRVKHLFFCLFPLKKIWCFKKWWFSCIKNFCFPLKKFIFYHNFLQKCADFIWKIIMFHNELTKVLKLGNVLFSFEKKVTNLSQFFLKNLWRSEQKMLLSWRFEGKALV